MRARHTLRAVVVLGVIIGCFFALDALGRAGLVPSLPALMTMPMSRLAAQEGGTGDSPAPPPPVPVHMAPEAPPAPEGAPLRAQGAPPPATVQAQQPKPSPLPALPLPPTPGLSTQQPDAPSPVAAAETMTVENTAVSVDGIMQAGRDLVRTGVRLPRLDSTWDSRDVEALVARHDGLVVAEWQHGAYRVLPNGTSVVGATDFVAMTQEARCSISNRGISLETTPAFRPLLGRLRERLGARPSDSLSLTFYPSSRLDGEFAAKQLGALRTLGIDVAAHNDIATVGDLRVTRDSAAYVIREVRVGGSVRRFADPQARILAAEPN